MRLQFTVKQVLTWGIIFNLGFGIAVLLWAHTNNVGREHATFPSEYGVSVGDVPEEVVGNMLFKARVDCFWTHPGARPYSGSTEAALRALNLPATARETILNKIKTRDYVARVSSAFRKPFSGGETHQTFGLTYAMTFGSNTICYNTRSMFATEEWGDLYEAEGYWIWIPDVCKNVSRLFPWHEAKAYEAGKRPWIIPDVPRGAQPYRVDYTERLSNASPRQQYYRNGAEIVKYEAVPEPETLLLFALGATLLVLNRYRRKCNG